MKLHLVMSREVIAAIASIALFATVQSAVAADHTLSLNDTIGLSELLGGDSLQYGDKLFDDFSFDSLDFGGSDVLVKAIVDLDGNIGLRFESDWQAVGSDATGFVLQFSVEVLDPNQLINGVTLLTSDVTTYGDGYVSVAEDVHSGSIPGGVKIADLEVHDPPEASDSAVFEPLSKIWILKDIQIVGDGHRRLAVEENLGPTAIGAIEQSFSQIPEPSTVLMVGAALFGLVATGRRNR